MTTPLVLGIDFGTCRTSAAVLVGDDIHPVRLAPNAYEHAYDMPTAVFVESDGRMLVGEEAVNGALRDPSSFFESFKLRLGGSGTVSVGERELSLRDLVAAVLLRVRLQAQSQLNNDAPILYAVITVPTLYVEGGDAWKVMEDAALQAGFEEVRLVREPHAAAIHYDALLREGSNVVLSDGEITLVYDLGGGTFDPALIRREGGEYRILGAVSGDEGVRCGGVFFDEKIREDFAVKCPQVMEQVVLPLEQSDDSPARRRAMRDRQTLGTFLLKAKWNLSEPQGDVFHEAEPVLLEDYRLTREEFHSMIGSLLDATLECCDNLVRRSGVAWKDIARILMVGGSCHIPLVRKKLEAYAKNQGSSPEICWRRIGTTGRYYDPLFAVSLGAAWAGRTLLADLHLREADDFWKKESWDKTSPLLQKAAKYGNAKAQRLWAESLECGLGIEQNLSESATWYRKSASQGDAEARFALGYLLERGEGVELNEREALELYQKAAEQGHAGAMFRAGLLGSETNTEASLALFLKSAHEGHMGAASLLGEIQACKASRTSRWSRLSERNILTNAQQIERVSVFVPWPDRGIPWNPKIQYGVFVDPRDGHKYRTVKIGKQTWLAENFAFNVPGSWVYEGKQVNEAKYGRLYDWETAKKVVPPGWHLPTDEEWMELEMFAGMSATKVKESGGRKTSDEGDKLKSISGWTTNVGRDQFGFRVLPAGRRDPDSTFSSLGNDANFWSASPEGSSHAWCRNFIHVSASVSRDWRDRSYGRSVRLLEN